MSIYQNREYMSDGNGNVHIFVERQEYLYSIVVLVDKVNATFNGVVTFVATNEHGFDETSVNITVQEAMEQPSGTGAPKFVDSPPKEVSIPVGSTALTTESGDISFTIGADPVPEIRLELNGEPIPEDHVRVVIYLHSVLTI